jgi:hypothetical protein
LLGKVFFALLLGMQAGPASNKVFIPTSAALDLAEKVARGEGYSLSDRTKFFFDVMLDKENKPVFAGYVTVGFYWNSDIVSAVSIDEETGQVLDIDKCTVFDYPGVRRFQRDLSRETGVPALSPDALRKKVGCDSLKKLSVPRKTP